MPSKILLGPPQYEDLMSAAVSQLQRAGYDVVPSPDEGVIDHAHLLRHADDCVAVIAGTELWRGEEFELLPNLSALVKCGSGVDNIDLEAARTRGIKVANSPGMNSNAVAEFCVGLMLSILRGIHRAACAMENGKRPLISGIELTGKTVGIVGWGNIGQLVGRRLSGFDVKLLCFDPFIKNPGPDVQQTRTLEELVEISDIVSLHLPATAETIGLFDAELFGHCRKGSFLINASRGALIDENALMAAIEAKQLAGAALDVQANESPEGSRRLRGHPNILLTPHLGAETQEAYDRVGKVNAEDVIMLLDGKESPRQLV